MSVLDELQFTDLSLDLSDFVDRFRSQLPVILITKTGIDPSDDPLHCISAEEIYWIDGIQRQKRIVAEDVKDDENKRYFSIPLDYHRWFQLVSVEGRREILRSPASLQKIVQGMNLTTGPTKFIFANSNNIRVNIEGSKSRFQKIETLKVVDSYEQKYLVGHTLYKSKNSDVMDMMPRSIPIYLDITVDVATGFSGKTQATFKQWMRKMEELGRNKESKTAKTCGEIIQFRELPECGVYDYIQPSSYLRTQDMTKQEGTESNGPSPPNNCNLSPSRETVRESQRDSSIPPPLPERSYGTRPLPPIPSQTSNSKTKRPTPAPPFPSDVEQGYEECRPDLATAYRGPEEHSGYQIAPYAESRLSPLQKSLIRRKQQHKTAALSQADADPCYSECRPARPAGPFLKRDDASPDTLRYACVYEILPYSESKKYFPEPPLASYSNTTSGETSVNSAKLEDIYGEAMPVNPSVIPRNFEDIYGEFTYKPTSANSGKFSDIYSEAASVDPKNFEDIYGEEKHATVTSKKMEECRLDSQTKLPADNTRREVDFNADHSPPPDLFQFQHLSEVPKHIDLSSVSVSEFTHCLSLLGLSKYSDVFRENDVDGKLAKEFNIETLVGSFNFSNFEAMKFIQFLKGWRPTIA